MGTVAAPLDLRTYVSSVASLDAAAIPSTKPFEYPSARPLIAFGLVAAALATSGVTTAAYAQRLAAVSLPIAAVNQPAPPAQTLPAISPIKGTLQPLLDQFAAPDRDKWGIVVKNLQSGETATINADRPITSASLYKLFVAQGIYKAIDTANLSYGQAAGSGTGYNIQTCLNRMITFSDNDCGRALGTLVGWDELNPGLAAAGFTGTDMSNPVQQTSAHDVALLFDRLYSGTLASPNSNAQFLSLLKAQQVNNRLPVGLPAGTVIAHKTGDLNGFIHDGGIVYGPKNDYLVVITSGSWDGSDNTPARFADLSAKLYNYFEN